MAITKEKAMVYKIIIDLFWKSMFSLAILISFFLILNKIFGISDWKIVAPLSFVEIFLANTMFRVFKHYFPIKENNTKKA